MSYSGLTIYCIVYNIGYHHFLCLFSNSDSSYCHKGNPIILLGLIFLVCAVFFLSYLFVQFSPTSEHILLAYGRRHSSLLKSIVVNGETSLPIYTVLEVKNLAPSFL